MSVHYFLLLSLDVAIKRFPVDRARLRAKEQAKQQQQQQKTNWRGIDNIMRLIREEERERQPIFFYSRWNERDR